MNNLKQWFDLGYTQSELKKDLNLILAIIGYFVYQFYKLPEHAFADLLPYLETNAIPMIVAKVGATYFAVNPNNPPSPAVPPAQGITWQTPTLTPPQQNR